ncbi:MAG: hypothetical protein MN733_13160 [Nitrososphaera sp.]|nr:hypothetical protein [Nitrososphaera sp.]
MSNRIIELHDSEIEDIASRGDGSAVIRFSTAYVHESDGVPGVDKGIGLVQRAELIIERGQMTGKAPSFPMQISSGFTALSGKKQDNVITIPLDFSGEFEVQIVFVSGHEMSIRGVGAKPIMYGEPEYVEEFPGS